MKLTKAQKRVFDFLCKFIKETGFAPTRNDIAVGVGYKSHNAAQEILVRLENKGFIKIEHGKHRVIEIV